MGICREIWNSLLLSLQIFCPILFLIFFYDSHYRYIKIFKHFLKHDLHALFFLFHTFFFLCIIFCISYWFLFQVTKLVFFYLQSAIQAIHLILNSRILFFNYGKFLCSYVSIFCWNFFLFTYFFFLYLLCIFLNNSRIFKIFACKFCYLCILLNVFWQFFSLFFCLSLFLFSDLVYNIFIACQILCIKETQKFNMLLFHLRMFFLMLDR